MRVLLILLVSVLGVLQSKAQENFTSFFEPEIQINYDVSPKYSHSFGIENRNIFYEDSYLGYEAKQLDVSHFSEFKLAETKAIGLGIQYRFENTFDGSEENELRIMQQFEWKNVKSSFAITHRLRTEQRLYASTTKYRLRYEFGLAFPLNTTTYLKTETETLFELANIQKPELEQRISAAYGFTVCSNTGLEIGTQYRLADYTQDLGHELFIVIGIEIDLNRFYF
ncbi:DUF2490 domain-containing protein [Maribacter sp. X9]|uniref:DUF2490 domain-containing protein n=1 Tax=Maribacter sp. X9 TaxID=3402159 RepID=UPI003AF3AC89